ncbi:hypothetical protein EA770_06940 [Acinetobacter baumannii]|nr:hypothetical protein EA770_06940 [Acinetobacter baumannii]
MNSAQVLFALNVEAVRFLLVAIILVQVYKLNAETVAIAGAKNMNTDEKNAFSIWHVAEYGEHVTWSNGVPASHIHNDRWSGWKASTLRAESQHKNNVVIQSQGLILTCEELLEALQYGAPDLKIEKTEYSNEQMSTEMTIVHRDTGPNGAGFYAYYTEYPEEGSIKLGGADE